MTLQLDDRPTNGGPTRNPQTERAEGVAFMRGLCYGLAGSAALWVLIVTAILAVF